MKNKPHCRNLGIIVSNDLIPSHICKIMAKTIRLANSIR